MAPLRRETADAAFAIDPFGNRDLLPIKRNNAKLLRQIRRSFFTRFLEKGYIRHFDAGQFTGALKWSTIGQPNESENAS